MKAGRPKSIPVAWKSEPACEKCRHLEIGLRGGLSCGKGHALVASGCRDYADASRQRYELGGITGRMFQR